jgi:preprotein translocase subunit YajC
MLNVVMLQASIGGINPQFIMLGGILIVFYFFMIRPQQTKAKQQTKFRDALSKGDTVVTIGGMHGKIVEFSDDNETVTIEVDRTVKLKFEKSSISMEATEKAQKKEATK